jgi:hypothetical protein
MYSWVKIQGCFSTSCHAEGLVNPKVLTQKKVTDFGIAQAPEHVDSENIRLKIGHRPLLNQLFSKRDFYFIKCG